MISTYQRPAPTPIRALWIVALALIVTGCTGNFVYNRLDTMAGWYLRSLVSLDDGQRSQLQGWLTQTLAWHRQSELTRYAQFLRDLSGELSQPKPPAYSLAAHDPAGPDLADPDLAGYEQVQKRLEAFWDDFIAKTSPEAERLLLSLSPAQVDELLANMAGKTSKRAEEDNDTDKWRRAQIKGLTRQVKRWTGSVSAPQKELIAATVAQIEPTRAEWLASQRSWQDALRQSLSGDATAGRIQQLLAQPQAQWSAQYAQKERRNRQRYLRLIASLDASLTPQQRERLRTELLKLAQQLEAIAQE